MPQEHTALVAVPTHAMLRHSKRLIVLFLTASLVAHAAVVVFFPAFYQDIVPAVPSVLEVSILKPEPLPVAVPRPEPSTQLQQAEPEHKLAKDDSKSGAEQRAPILALSKPEPALEGSFTVAPPRLPEPPPPAPDPKFQAATTQVTPPSFDAAYLSNPSPRYPQVSRRAGEQGTVTLRVLVKRDGLPARVVVESSSGSPHLDVAAQDAVWGWRFVPARQGADPIESWVLVPVVFRLEGAS